MTGDKMLNGRVALVTGASSGLGRRFATVLAAAGARVAVAARRADRLETLVAEIEAAAGEAAPFILDVTDVSALPATLDAIEARFGTVDILVNNAGIVDAALATKMPLDLIDRVFDTNLKAPFILAREVGRRLIAARQRGWIVNLSSIGAYQYGAPGGSLYSITKAAISRMTEVLAVEWAARGINVNAIAPGSFDSEMNDAFVQRIGSDFIQAYPRRRICDPEELDSTLLYLVDPRSSAVTGVIVKVDDGQFPR